MSATSSTEMSSWLRHGPGEKIVQGFAQIAFLVIFCGANFFASIYVHHRSHESLLRYEKKREAELDISISMISKSIPMLEKCCEALRGARARALADSLPEAEIAKYDKELYAVVCKIGNMNYLLSSLRGGIQPDKLSAAAEIIARRAAANLNTAAYIDRQVLTLAVTRDVDIMRVPVSPSTVEEALEQYTDCSVRAHNLTVV